MFKITFKKKRKGIATITIVLLLGFLSLLSSTSIFTFNTWRWDNLEMSIKKENQLQAVASASLYTYVLLARQRDDTTGAWPVFDTYENLLAYLPTNISVGSLTTLDTCNPVTQMPAELDSKTIKRISIISQKGNILINQSCCTAGTYLDSTDEEVQNEGFIYQFSKQRCKNFNWPNLKDQSIPLMTTTMTP